MAYLILNFIIGASPWSFRNALVRQEDKKPLAKGWSAKEAWETSHLDLEVQCEGPV